MKNPMNSLKLNSETYSGIELKVLFAVLAVFVGTLGFIIISVFVTKGTTDYFDMIVLQSLRTTGNLAHPIGPRWLFEMMRDITSLGGATIVFLITLFVFGYLIMKKQYSMLFLVLAAVIGGALIDLELKEIFSRIRPQIVPSLIMERSYGFPSGHSMMSAVIYLSLASLIARLQKRWREKIYIIAVAVLLSFMIGISRIYLGVHYPTDVFGGWSLGLAWAALCWLVAWFFNERKSNLIKIK
jgi:undecaprenyl-diphosphatase